MDIRSPAAAGIEQRIKCSQPSAGRAAPNVPGRERQEPEPAAHSADHSHWLAAPEIFAATALGGRISVVA